MIDIFERGLEYLKNNYKLPETGFLAGGALGNIIWQLVSGNKAVINDIDIYIKSTETYIPDSITGGFTIKTYTPQVVTDDYKRTYFTNRLKNYFQISEVLYDGYINTIKFKSNADTYQIILEQFDINCCQVGYDLEDKKFYYTEDFIYFLSTGSLKITSLYTPAHTLLRLFKKSDELKATISTSEILLIEVCIEAPFIYETTRYRFKNKYLDLYNKYKNELNSKFELFKERDHLKEDVYGIKLTKYNIINNKDRKYIKNAFEKFYGSVKNDIFLNWFREIYKNEYLENMWQVLYPIYDIKFKPQEYFDVKINENDLNFLNNILKYSPKSIINLTGKTLSKQLNICKNIFETYRNEPAIAMSILESEKIDIETYDLNDSFSILLLLELLVRKEMLDNDTILRVNKIINISTEEQSDLAELF